MADNVETNAGTGGAKIAAEEVTHSGDTAQIQLIGVKHVTGSEGSKVVNEVFRAEDAAHTSGDFGLPVIGVRQDTATSLAGTDGDYTMPIFDASGRQHVNVGSSALPTGAATSAKQDTVIGHLDGVEGLLGTIDADTGNISTKIDTVAGAVSGTEMQTDVLTVPADPFGANADAASATGSISAKLRFIASTGIPVTGTVTVGSHAVTNAGTFATQVDGAALTALQKIDDPVLVDDAAFTPGTSSVAMSGFEADETATDSVDEGDAGAARMTLDRKQIVTIQPHTSGGASIFRSIDLDETEEEIKGTAGQVYGWFMTNLASSTRYIKFYNDTAANVTVGSTTPVMTIPLEPDQAANVAFPNGIAFSAAITAAATTGIADADTGAPGANEVVVNVFYK